MIGLWGQRGRARAGRRVGSAVRACAALCLLFHFVYTPFHLYLEPHCDDVHWGKVVAAEHPSLCVIPDARHCEDHHGRHSAEEHRYDATPFPRGLVLGPMLVEVWEWGGLREGSWEGDGVAEAVLSPPEVSCSWQFCLRAALPVRAPSLLS